MDPIEICLKKYGAAIGKAIAESLADSEDEPEVIEAGYGIGYFAAKLAEYLEDTQPYFDEVTNQVEEIIMAIQDNFE